MLLNMPALSIRNGIVPAMTIIDTALADGYSLAMQPVTEKILLDQARDGQDQAFAQLIEAHSEKIITVAWRMVGQRDIAEDIAQEAFLRLYKSLANFRGESSVGTWLYRTATRLSIDHLRREQLRRKIFFFRSTDSGLADPVDLAISPSASPQDILLAKETQERIQQVLNTLPARQKAVFVLRQMEGLTLKEIAVTLGLQEGTVKSHLHRAVTRFREEFFQKKEA